MIYRKTGSNISLESAGFAGGRFVARETSPGVSAMVSMIHVTDHLGSVRAVVDGVSGEVVETNDYYPFGGRWDVAASLKDDSNRFRYNSKEEQFRFGRLTSTTEPVSTTQSSAAGSPRIRSRRSTAASRRMLSVPEIR